MILDCKLVPTQYQENENVLFLWFGYSLWSMKFAECQTPAPNSLFVVRFTHVCLQFYSFHLMEKKASYDIRPLQKFKPNCRLTRVKLTTSKQFIRYWTVYQISLPNGIAVRQLYITVDLTYRSHMWQMQ